MHFTRSGAGLCWALDLWFVVSDRVILRMVRDLSEVQNLLVLGHE